MGRRPDARRLNRYWLLYYGSRVEVLEPPELRERVAEEHGRAVRMYE